MGKYIAQIMRRIWRCFQRLARTGRDDFSHADGPHRAGAGEFQRRLDMDIGYVGVECVGDRTEHIAVMGHGSPAPIAQRQWTTLAILVGRPLPVVVVVPLVRRAPHIRPEVNGPPSLEKVYCARALQAPARSRFYRARTRIQPDRVVFVPDAQAGHCAADLQSAGGARLRQFGAGARRRFGQAPEQAVRHFGVRRTVGQKDQVGVCGRRWSRGSVG